MVSLYECVQQTIAKQRNWKSSPTYPAIWSPLCSEGLPFVEEQRMSKSFQERKSDVDGAIEWIVKEIKFLQQQDQDLMKQFAKLRGVLNSIKDRPEDPPQFDRQISLPEDSPWSPMFLDYSITEDSPTTFHRDEVSPGLRRRAYSDFAGTVPHYPLSKLVYDDGFGSEERFENFLI